MTIDFALIAALYLGLASILQLQFIQIPMWIIGAVFFIFIGLSSIKNADKDITLYSEKPVKSLSSSYRNGFLVAVSPCNIILWLSVFGAVLSSTYDTSNSGSFILITAGILTGILLHDIGLLTLTIFTRKIMNHKMIKWVSIIAGSTLIGFSEYFIYEFIVSIKSVIG